MPKTKRLTALICGFLSITVTLSLSGCSGKTGAGFDRHTLDDFNSRVSQQQEYIRQLEYANAISPETSAAMIASTEGWIQFLREADAKAKTDTGSGENSSLTVNSQQFAQLQRALSLVNEASILGGGSHQYTHQNNGALRETNGGLGIGARKTPEPYGFSGNDMASLQKSTRYNVKVLKEQLDADTTLDSLAKAISDAKASGLKDKTAWTVLEGYFQDSGKVTTTMPILHATMPWDDQSHIIDDKSGTTVPALSEGLLRSVYPNGGVGGLAVNADIWDLTEPNGNSAGFHWKDETVGANYLRQDETGMHDLKIFTTGYHLVTVWVADENEAGGGHYEDKVTEHPEFAGLVRLEQVNKLFVDIITGKSSSDKMFINTATNTTYLIEYPVFVLDQISLAEDGKRFESTLKESDLVINLAAGEVRRRNKLSLELGKKPEAAGSGSGGGSGGTSDTGNTGGTGTSSNSYNNTYIAPEVKAHGADTWEGVTPVNTTNTFIYKLTEKQVQADEGKSLVPTSAMTARLSFAFDGGSSTVTNIDEFPWADEALYNNEKMDDAPNSSANSTSHPDIKSARIVLMDYAELLDIPSVVDSEQFIATGRFFRVKRFAGTLTDVFAVYLDNAGNEMPEIYTSFKVTDLLDASSRQEKIKLDRGVVSAETGTDTNAADLDTAAANSLHRAVKYVDKIGVSVRFPSEEIDRTDYANDIQNAPNRPVMYAMKADLSPFVTNLYANWVKRSDDTQNSLGWWNNWLSDNFFNYRIDVNRLDQSFLGNYSFEMQQAGMIILDPATIMLIQADINKTNALRAAGNVKTVFLLLGIFLIFYAVLLPLAWFLDINLTFGAKVLEILTLGRLSAVSESYGDKREATLRDAILLSAAVCAVGVLIIAGNGTGVFADVLRWFGSVSKNLKSLIFN
ncbi:hypothetical protein AGMMS49975_18990 [Clostridia bacterium]|nr:hypothetical protein AGMMS49975_18990 [Clostridia bacterium]